MANELQQVLNNIKKDKDTNLLPTNLKDGVTCLGIEGTLENKVKLFNTVEEMNQSAGNNENDIALIYSNKLSNIAFGDENITEITFPEQVQLPQQVTESDRYSYQLMGGLFGRTSFSLTSESAVFIVSTSGWRTTTVRYTSTDGINYTRTTEVTNPLTISSMSITDREENWTDLFGYFMQINKNIFGGLYQYTNSTWVILETQLNLSSSNQLLPGVLAYGKNGLITGDETIFNNIKNKDFINNWLNGATNTTNRSAYQIGKSVNYQTFVKQSYFVNDELNTPLSSDDCISYMSSTSSLEYTIPEYDFSSKTSNKAIRCYDRYNDTNYYIHLLYNMDSGTSTITNVCFYVIDLDTHTLYKKAEYNQSWRPVNNSEGVSNYMSGDIASIGYDFDSNTLYMVCDKHMNTSGSLEFTPINVASLTSTGDFDISYNNVVIGSSSINTYATTLYDSFRWDNINKSWSFVYKSWQQSSSINYYIGKININSEYEELISNGTNELNITSKPYANLGPFIEVSNSTTSGDIEHYVYNAKTKTKLDINGGSIDNGNKMYSCYNNYIIASLYDTDGNAHIYKINQNTNEYEILPIEISEIYSIIYCIVDNKQSIFVCDSNHTTGKIYTEDGTFLGCYAAYSDLFSQFTLPFVLNSTDTGIQEVFTQHIYFNNENITYKTSNQVWEKFVEITEFPVKGNIGIVCINDENTKNTKVGMFNCILLTDNIIKSNYTGTISPTEYNTALKTSKQILGVKEEVQ